MKRILKYAGLVLVSLFFLIGGRAHHRHPNAMTRRAGTDTECQPQERMT
jgi:hypothetical protein